MMSETVTVCPECGSHDYYRRRSSMAEYDASARHRCWDCGARFDDPAERERRSAAQIPTGTAAAMLDAADPDTVDL